MPDPTIKPFHVPAYKQTQYRNSTYPLPNLQLVHDALRKFMKKEGKREWEYTAHTRREGDRYLKQLANIYELYTNKNGKVKTFYKNKPVKAKTNKKGEDHEEGDGDEDTKTEPIRQIEWTDEKESAVKTLLEKYKRRYHNELTHVNKKLDTEKSIKQKEKLKRRAERKKAEKAAKKSAASPKENVGK